MNDYSKARSREWLTQDQKTVRKILEDNADPKNTRHGILSEDEVYTLTLGNISKAVYLDEES